MPRSLSPATTTAATRRTVSFVESSLSVNDDDEDHDDMVVANDEHQQGQQQQQYHHVSSFFFLSESAVEKLAHFVYQGEDKSLLYYYILSPLASFCVEYLTPHYVAPNCITLFGLCLMISSYSIMWWYYVPFTLEQPPPTPTAPACIFLWNALSILCYQTLDNMDGKQARRTGSSSPLGLLFDHGCDAINSLFGSVGWMISCGLNPFDTHTNDSFLCFTMLFGPYALFYIGTWEEYYTGKLIMPIMNGPNEGLLGAVLVSLTAWWYGPQFWLQYTVWDEYLATPLQILLGAQKSVWLGDIVTTSIRLRHVDLLVLASCIGYIQEISIKIWSVVRSTCYYDRQQQHHSSNSGVVTIVVTNPQPCFDLLPFAVLVVCFWIVGYIDLNIWLDMPRTSLHLSSVLFAEMTTDLMLAHVTGQAYNQARSPLLQQQRWILLMPLMFLTLAVVLGICSTSSSTSNSSASRRRATSDFLLVYTTVVTCYFATKAVMVINEMCTVLNIWCFDITTPRVQSQQQCAIHSTLARHENGHSKTE